MSDPLQTLEALLQSSAAAPQSFAPNSRYYGLPTLTQTFADGRTITYLTRRFVPRPGSFALLKQHSVVQNDRPDLLAATYFNDPLQYWRICDANTVLRPAALVETIGYSLRITLPAGVPGTTQGL